MPRLEYKYLIHNENLDKLRSSIIPFIVRDDHARNADIPEYSVRSIYFDTPSLRYYTEKIEGVDIRKKLRIRGYNDGGNEDEVYLEIKRKNIQTVWKNRAPMRFKHVRRFFATGNVQKYIITGNGIADADENARKFLYHLHGSMLRPVVLVTYEREAYFGKFDRSVRITFDKNLRSAIYPQLDELYSEEKLVNCLPGRFVVEVKFTGTMPLWMRSALRVFGARRQAVSKYCIGLDMHRKTSHHFTKPAVCALSDNF